MTKFELSDGSGMMVEFRLVNDDELPPVILKQHEEDSSLVIVINLNDRIWLSLQRKAIAGSAKMLYSEIDNILDGYLKEQLAY